MDFIISIISLYITYLILKAIFNGLRKIFFSSNAQNEKDAHTKKIETPQTTKSSPTHTSGNLNWKIEDNALIIGGVGDMENYSEEKTPPWHNKHEEIKKVIIESGITIIGDCAFRGLKNLEEVIISNNVNAIGVRAFESCKSLKKVTFPKNVLTIIGVSAFASCTSLEKVQINAEFIAVSAFTNCTSLANITLTENVVAIFDGAFNNCTSLTEIKIPTSVTSINEKIFDGCLNLQKIFYPAGSDPEKKLQVGNNAQLIPFGEPPIISSNPPATAQIKQNEQPRPVKSSQTNTKENLQWNSAGNLRWKIEGNTLTISGKGKMKYGNSETAPWLSKNIDERKIIKKVFIEDGITSIGTGAFWSCTNLQSITSSTSITSIGNGAFWSCTNLRTMAILASITTIGDHAFANCANLTTIRIFDGVKKIGNDAFAYCTSLTEVKIPYSVTSIGSDIFLGCDNLKKIYCPANSSFKGILEGTNAQLIRY